MYMPWASFYHGHLPEIKLCLVDVHSSLRHGDKLEANENFVVSRTKNAFSSTGLDQIHEQFNKDVKGSDGMVGLREVEDKLRQWTICSRGISRAVAEFEKYTVLETTDHTAFHHHEDSDSCKARFSKDVSDVPT